MIRRLIALVRCCGGAAAVELALIAPVLAGMVAGIADVSIAYSRKLELEQAAQRAIEKVMQTTGVDTEANTIREEACIQINGSFSNPISSTATDPVTGAVTTTVTPNMDCSPGRISINDVTVEYTLTCDGAEVPDFDSECSSTQAEARYISATVVDTYDPMFPLTFATGPDGVYNLSVTAGVRVE